ncbi:hypothetical protein CLV42_105175 [Chitinophaga ginsengisoli]|uniref:Uncharacterized protein n=1 Tax=Chitinophaga ginsengisoli TaxID=363837 RepID=A0A2P8GA29_9BACT|nr:hypothetical protein CLV42_105175 [Chitinophaga ginsengisoli]
MVAVAKMEESLLSRDFGVMLTGNQVFIDGYLK